MTHQIEIETTSHPTRARWACSVCNTHGAWVKAADVRRSADAHEAQPVLVRAADKGVRS